MKISGIKNIYKLLKEKNVTSNEVTLEAIDLVKKYNTKLNAFNTITEDNALNSAKESDDRFQKNESLGILDGIPMSIKDVIITKGIRTTASSKILSDFIPEYQSTVAEKLFSKGAVMIGKNNSDPFAFGASGENSGFGPTKNPLCITKVPGGSSSGSASSISAGIGYYSIGTDTGGSIRQPASLTGITGLKLSYGRNSRFGLISMASSLDSVGILANSAEDCAIVEDAIKGFDEKDSTTKKIEDKHLVEYLDKDIKGMRIGLPKEYFIDGLDSDIKESILKSVKEFEMHGAIVEEISLPHTPYALAVYYLIVPSEISSNMGRYDGIRYGYHPDSKTIDEFLFSAREDLEEEVKRRIIIGTFALSSGYSDEYYKKAMKVRSLIIQDFNSAFEKYDAIITPTSPSVAWNIGEKVEDPKSMYLADIFTVTANLAGIPGISIKCGEKKIEAKDADVDIWGNRVTSLPIGLQLLANRWKEGNIIQLADYYQKNIFTS